MKGLAGTGHGLASSFDLTTRVFEACAITVNVSGIEIFGFRFGASPQDIARAVAGQTAARVGLQCRR